MVRFMIYLLETGVCLSLLYLAYWLFLRKETYFNFNRLFLVGSFVLTLGVPLLHVNFFVPEGSSLANSARGIVKFRSYYEERIRMIDADFGIEPGSRHSVDREGFGDFDLAEGGMIPSNASHGTNLEYVGNNSASEKSGLSGFFTLTRILIIIYIGGVIYFFARFIYLVLRLYLLGKRNRVTRQDGFRMVEIKEDISPFSFFHFLFINNGSLNDAEFQHVLEHERAHIMHRHSIDHLFAHGLAVFQWFNPFAWQIRKALKTTHEYIADRQVLNRGIELFDYQSLLLKQVIGYHSVELVNNFNLQPIKKRIAMMNKNRSGMLAKFKALLVIPFALIVFFLFADFTLKGSSNPAIDPVSEIEGLWIKQSKDNFSSTLLIKDAKFSFTEGMLLKDYFLRTEKKALILSEREGARGVKLNFEVSGDELTIWWNDTKGSRYIRSAGHNTLDHYLQKQGLDFDLTSISHYRLLDDQRIFRICYGLDRKGGTALTFNGKPFTLVDLKELVEKEKSKHSKLDQVSLTAVFLIDKSIPMILVEQVRQELRNMNALHFAEGGYPHGDIDLSPLLYHSVALPRLLPPLNAKVLDKQEMIRNGGIVHTIDLAGRNSTPRDVDKNLQKFISDHEGGKYVISLEYDGKIPYGQYIETVDMIYNVVYRFRNELAMKKYNVTYDKLGDELQREIRKAYPMALSESGSSN